MAEPQDAERVGHTDNRDELTEEEREVLLRVAAVLRRIEYGSVLLVVQDGKVVQIEAAEKYRLR
jgi:hypothetical protein